MVSKLQTFEEWVVGSHEFSADPFIAARQAWQAAHENAARVADKLYLGGRSETDYLQGYDDGIDRVAQAIREAAK